MGYSSAHPDGSWRFDLLAATAIDGDTARVTVDLGFGADFRFDLRLRNVSAPELRDPGGPEAKMAFQGFLDNLKGMMVTTYRSIGGKEVQSFARWLGRISTADGQDLGELLVAQGFATVTIYS